MAKLSEYDDVAARSRIAREEFINSYCSHWPLIYRSIIPVTDLGHKLLAAYKEGEQMIARDFEALRQESASPWIKSGPSPFCVDWNGVDNHGRINLGLKHSRSIGMPAAIRIGFESHPLVVQARDNVSRTAEFVAHEKKKSASDRFVEVTSRYVAASNSALNTETARREGVSYADVVKAAKGKTLPEPVTAEQLAAINEEYKLAQAELEQAEAECRRLAGDIPAAMQFVR